MLNVLAVWLQKFGIWLFPQIWKERKAIWGLKKIKIVRFSFAFLQTSTSALLHPFRSVNPFVCPNIRLSSSIHFPFFYLSFCLCIFSCFHCSFHISFCTSVLPFFLFFLLPSFLLPVHPSFPTFPASLLLSFLASSVFLVLFWLSIYPSVLPFLFFSFLPFLSFLPSCLSCFLVTFFIPCFVHFSIFYCVYLSGLPSFLSLLLPSFFTSFFLLLSCLSIWPFLIHHFSLFCSFLLSSLLLCFLNYFILPSFILSV